MLISQSQVRRRLGMEEDTPACTGYKQVWRFESYETCVQRHENMDCLTELRCLQSPAGLWGVGILAGNLLELLRTWVIKNWVIQRGNSKCNEHTDREKNHGNKTKPAANKYHALEIAVWTPSAAVIPWHYNLMFDEKQCPRTSVNQTLSRSAVTYYRRCLLFAWRRFPVLRQHTQVLSQSTISTQLSRDRAGVHVIGRPSFVGLATTIPATTRKDD